jgi:hypothetical protein
MLGSKLKMSCKSQQAETKQQQQTAAGSTGNSSRGLRASENA